MDSIEQLKQQIKDLTQQLYEAERSQIMIPNWDSLINDLNKAGLASLFAAIVYQSHQTPNPPDRILEAEALNLIAECKNASNQSDRIGVIEAYGNLMALAQEVMSPELGLLIQTTMPALQKVLDDWAIPKSLLAFLP